MPTNLTKQYNQLLDLMYSTERQNLQSIRAIFNRDIPNHPHFAFQNKPVLPTTAEGEDTMDRLFRHLTTVVTDEATRKREFESERSIRIHWIRYHVDGLGTVKPFIFHGPTEDKIYLLDKSEKYVIVLQLLRNKAPYYLLTAFKLEPSNYRGLLTKFEKRGKEGLP